MNLAGLDLDQLELMVDREIYQRSFYAFVKRAWREIDPAPFRDNWHIKVVADHLQAVSEGLITRLAICIPPGHGKSLLVSVLFPAWEWTHKPHMSYLSTSHSQDFSSRDTRRARDLITSAWYQSLWPIEFKADQDSKTFYVNKQMGQRQAKSFGSLTGARGHRLLIDDPISANDALSVAARLNVKTITLESVPTRLNDVQTDAIIIVAQRLHQEDIIGVVVEANLGYEVLSIPAEYKGDKVFSTILKMEDPRNHIGELIFPEYQNKETIENFKRSLGPYSFSAQFSQDPVPRGEGFFDLDKIRYYGPDSPYKLPPQSELSVYMASDHAYGRTGKGDNTAIVVYGIDKHFNFWLLDSYTACVPLNEALGIGRLEGAIGIKTTGALRLVEKWKPRCWFPEQDPAWLESENLVKRTMRELNIQCRIQPITTRGGDKAAKAQSLDAAIRLDQIYWPRDWDDKLATLEEFAAFPHAGTHDDRVDAHSNLLRAGNLFKAIVQPPEVADGPVDGYQRNSARARIDRTNQGSYYGM